MAENEPAFVDSVQNFLSDKVCIKGAYLKEDTSAAKSMVTHNNIAHIRRGTKWRMQIHFVEVMQMKKNLKKKE